MLFSKGAPLWIPLGKAEEIEHLVRRYGTLVRGSPQEDELSANLQALYEALWAPIGLALRSQTKRIIISPDGELNFVSFATLLNKDKQFLAQTYRVQYVASGRDLLRELKPSIAREVVLFANPDFDLASTGMLAKADNDSSDPVPKSIGRGERGDIYCSRGRSGRFSDSGLRISVCRLGAIGELGADGFDLRLRFGLRPGPFEIGPELRLLSRRTALDSWARSPHFVGRRESYSVSRLRRS